MTAVFIEVPGWAWPVEWAGEVSRISDPLLEAVIDLVHGGYVTVQQLRDQLLVLPDGLVEGAVASAVAQGLFVENERGLLSSPGDRGDFIDRPEVEHGFIFWDVFRAKLVPSIVSGLDRPRSDRSASIIPFDSSSREYPPRRGEVTEHLAGLAREPALEVLEVNRMSGGFEPIESEVDALYLPVGARPFFTRLYVSIELRDSHDDRPNLVVRQADLLPREPSLSPLWSGGEEILRGQAATSGAMTEVDRRWRASRAEAVLGPLGGRYRSTEEIDEHLDAMLGALEPAWDKPELRAEARSALREAAAYAVGDPDDEHRRAVIGNAWGRFLSILTNQMYKEALPILRAPFAKEPTSVDEAKRFLRTHGVDLGPSTRHVLGDFPKRRGQGSILNKLRDYVPSCGGRKGGGGSQLGVGTYTYLWCVAMFVNERGRSEHLSRIRSVLEHEPELFALLDKMVQTRTSAAHPEKRRKKLPAPKVQEDCCIRIWRALGSASSSG